MLYFPNTLPGFVKLLIDFHDVYRRKCKSIYPWAQEAIAVSHTIRKFLYQK